MKRYLIVIAMVTMQTSPHVSLGQGTGGGPESSPRDKTPLTAQVPSDAAPNVLAYLGQQPITRREVDFVLGRTGLESSELGNLNLGNLNLGNPEQGNPEQGSVPRLSFAAEQAAISLVACQKQALQTLRKQKLAANREQVERWIQSNIHSPNAATVDEMVAEIAQRHAIDEEVYWDLMAFRLSWKSYLAQHLTNANIARHFANQSARFDGTKFQVQLLSATVPAGKSARRDSETKELAAVRDGLAVKTPAAGELEQLARDRNWQLSEEKWIDGSGELDPLAIDAVLELKAGETSQPVHTASGVHLIRLIGRQPGDLELDQVRDEVRAHLLVYLLHYLASLSQDELPLIAKD